MWLHFLVRKQFCWFIAIEARGLASINLASSDDGARVRHSRVVGSLHLPKVVGAFLMLLGRGGGVLSGHCDLCLVMAALEGIRCHIYTSGVGGNQRLRVGGFREIAFLRCTMLSLRQCLNQVRRR